ncbi:MAG: hypothetical protein FVQ85_10965 [Planctomycetes bacterium]|nr:hypothetical protein [Planctomycetota bacterium]
MSARTNRIITPLIVVFVLLTAAPTFAERIIYVDNDGPADFNNIQAAINNSKNGDTIIVAEGRYLENINFNVRNITLMSTDPCNPDVVAATIIDGNQKRSVVTFHSGEDANCVLNGFTITNGNAEYGGGIYCGRAPGPPGPPPPPPPPPPGTLSEQSSPEIFSETNLTAPVIKNCIISNNSAGSGGGMYNNWLSSPTLTNCTFSSNSANWGGGMSNSNSSPTLTNCTFSSNWADSGGGMENLDSSPTLTNCTFSGNSADHGGGMENIDSSPTLTNCTFKENSASREGGGMFNIESSPTFIKCTFNGNSASYDGGGMLNLVSSPILTDCTFNGNSASRSGGGMYNENVWGSQSSPTLTNCTFHGNSAGTNRIGRGGGGGILNLDSSPTLTNCTFSGNSADVGGGMLNFGSSPTLTNCTFNENSAYSGGGISNTSYTSTRESSPILTNCTFSSNSATYDGGGMNNSRSSPTLTNCTFSRNTARHRGGGMYNSSSSPTVTNCIFSANFVGFFGFIPAIYDYPLGFGGGMYNYYSSPIVDNCTFTGNAAGYYDGRGGGMCNDHSSPKVKKCTFSGNVGQHGGAMFNDSYPIPVINCIFWGNGSYGISGAVHATYSNIEGGLPGQGNIDADPCFVDLGYWDSNDTPDDTMDDFWIEGDYHLLPDSPCINTGDPNYIAETNERDLDGKPRVIGCRIDMGAFEYRHLVPAEVRIVPHTINLAKKGKRITALLWFPENYNVAEIDFCILLLEDEIEPEQLFINEKEQVMMARFNEEQLQAILDVGQVELTITAQLTNATCFQGTDVIRVIDEGGGKLAKYGKAGNPNPADGATDVGTTADLSWTAGYGATSHDVYFGTANPLPFIGNQTATTFDLGTMDYDTTYLWRIDEINKWGTTTGQLWNFTTYGPQPPPLPPPPP